MLNVVNPYKDAAKQNSGLELTLYKERSPKYWGFCWDCRTDKPKKNGKVFGKSRLGQPTRFRCSECVEEKALAKESNK